MAAATAATAVAVRRLSPAVMAPRYSMTQVVAGIPITPMSTSVHT